MPVSSKAQFVGHCRIVHALRRDDAANAQRHQGEGALTSLWLAEVGFEDIGELLQNLAISPFYRVSAAHDIRWERDQGAAGLSVGKMVVRKIRVNNALATWFSCNPWMGRLALPRLRRVSAEELSNGLGIKLILILEVAIEPTSCQSSGLHDFVDGDFGKSLPVEQPPRALENLMPCVTLVL